MRTVVNQHPWAVEVPDLRIVVEPGDVVELDDEDAERLLAQPRNWLPGHPCDECDFVAKTTGGLAAHERTHDDDSKDDS